MWEARGLSSRDVCVKWRRTRQRRKGKNARSSFPDTVYYTRLYEQWQHFISAWGHRMTGAPPAFFFIQSISLSTNNLEIFLHNKWLVQSCVRSCVRFFAAACGHIGWVGADCVVRVCRDVKGPACHTCDSACVRTYEHIAHERPETCAFVGLWISQHEIKLTFW